MIEEIPIDFLKNIDAYRPKIYTHNQLMRLSSRAKFNYIEKLTQYNSWCESLGLPEKKVNVKEHE